MNSKTKTGKDSEKGLFRKRLPLNFRILLYCLPAGVLLVVLTCIYGFTTSHGYVKDIIERNVKMRSAVITRTLEGFLEKCVQDVQYLNLGQLDSQRLMEFMTRRSVITPGVYREAAIIAQTPETSVVLVEAHQEVRQITPEQFSLVQPNPMYLPDSIPPLKDGEVYITPISLTHFPFASPKRIGNIEKCSAFRIVTPCKSLPHPDVETHGSGAYLMLAVDATYLRKILTASTTSENRAWGFDRSNEVRFSYLIDPEGWMLMQSVTSETEKGLSTFLARAGYFGTLGKQGIPGAFLPGKQHNVYWEIVEHLRKGENGFLTQKDEGYHNSPSVSSYFLSYDPIFYNNRAGGEKSFLFGLCYIDRSRLAFNSKRAFLMTALVWGGGALALVLLFLLIVRATAVMPLRRLRDAFVWRVESRDRSSIPYSGECVELSSFVSAANNLISTLDMCEKRLELITEDPMSEDMRQPVSLEAEYRRHVLPDLDFPELIGVSSAMRELKAQVIKAANASVDVFIVGETGTGKQLLAEAIHRCSSRRNGPFVAINCGALNESLLLDALFGHVKGAHSEAISDRKGAFIEAAGGILFLDEIQSASLKVQQSLLRAIAERKIRPLGSDQELPVDLRLITATNGDLPKLIREGAFREDLFYRLYVLTIQTTPLRMHKEDISLLAYHYLQQTQELVGKSGLQFSKGALKVLMNHDWPGNVRELVNSITRSVVFAEGPVIEATDLRMESASMYVENRAPLQRSQKNGSNGTDRGNDTWNRETAPVSRESAEPAALTDNEPKKNSAPSELSPRQLTALPRILDRKTISRKEYQQVVGNKLPAGPPTTTSTTSCKKASWSVKGKAPIPAIASHAAWT